MKDARGVEDGAALRDLLQEHYHNVSVSVREKRQKRVIPFEEERQRLAFMQRIGPAGKEIIQGQKTVVSADDQFRFSCTACGKCCTQSFSEHVVLDPHDVYLLSRAPSLAPLLGQEQEEKSRKTSQLLLRYAHAFSQEVGIYATRNGEETDIAGNKNESDQATPLAKIAGKTARQGWCHFAYPERSGSTGAPIRSFAEYAELRDQGKVSDADMQGKVRCGLGPDHMPFACSSFPMGELWTGSVKIKGTEAKRKVRFYWLDQVNCEGVNHPEAELRSVKDYTTDNRTEERLNEWEWFKDLVGSVGQKKLDEKLMERDPSGWSANVFFSILHSIWYDFDSFKDTNTSSAKEQEGPEALEPREWASLKACIQQRTERTVADLEQFCLAGPWSSPSSAAEAVQAEELFGQSFHSFLGKMVHDGVLTLNALDLALAQRHSHDAEGDASGSEWELDEGDSNEEKEEVDDDDDDMEQAETVSEEEEEEEEPTTTTTGPSIAERRSW